jgi:hypothetical protein
VLLVAACAAVLIAGVAVGDVAAVVASNHRAQLAADAVAHAAVGALAGDPGRTSLSIEVQAGRTICSRTGSTAPGDEPPACAAAWAAAGQASAAAGAVILELAVGPDFRDLLPGAGAGRLTVLAHVAVARRLVVPGRCRPTPPGPRADRLCWADAFSAAQEAG